MKWTNAKTTPPRSEEKVIMVTKGHGIVISHPRFWDKREITHWISLGDLPPIPEE